MSGRFGYADMTQRNIGFVTPAEQARLRASRVLVCGAGGMGGFCLESLARGGVGTIEIADFDRFEPSNLNRQILATRATLGESKTRVAAARLRSIQPGIKVRRHGRDWEVDLAAILKRVDVVVNAMDDVRAGIALYRAARTARVPVVDSFTSVLPSVFVTLPNDPRPEECLRFGTANRPIAEIDQSLTERSRRAEIEYVLTHSSTGRHLDFATLGRVLRGEIPRISFAPMVAISANLMAYEVLALACGRAANADHRGYFLNPYRGRIERPLPDRVARGRRQRAQRLLERLMGATSPRGRKS